jgi:uridine kinase
MNIVQIAGGEGAGKTTLATLLAEELTGIATILTLDRYRRNKRPDDSPAFALQPGAIDWPLVHAHMDALARGEHVVMPDYDLEAGHRLPMRLPQTDKLDLTPTDILIVEGMHYLPEEVESIRLFLDTPRDVRRERVRGRDAELGQHLCSIFDTIIEPAYDQYTLPLREQADLVLDGRLRLYQLVQLAQRRIASIWGAWG